MDPFMLGNNIILLIFLIVVGVIVFKISKGVLEWSHNNKQPILTVNSKLISKRTKTSSHRHNHGAHQHRHVTTDYYVSFEVEGGAHLEFTVSKKEYGQLAEGDMGRLTFQGTRYHEFVRVNFPSNQS